ncbi:MAG: response regulator [Bacteroidales bacterium]|nr:response regulator [Bacteroidales bacterium]
MEYEILTGKKILIVEDDLASRLYLNKILEKTGAILFNSGDGKDAVEVVRRNPDMDLILMDIQLPVMDGYAAAAEIKKLNNTTILIAQTAYGMQEDMDKIIAGGFDGYIIKPIFSDQLTGKLSSFFKK